MNGSMDVLAAPHRLSLIVRLVGTRVRLLSLVPIVVSMVVFKLALSDGGRQPPTLTAAQVVVYLLTAALIVAGAVRRTPVAAAVGLMAGVSAITLLWSVRPDATVRQVLLWLMYLGIVMITSSTVRGPRPIRLFVDAVVVIAGWLCLVALFMFWGAGNPGMRWYSTFYWPNPFAGFLLLALPLTLVRFLRAGGLRDALAHGLMALLLAVSLLLTYSRGAWATLAVVVPLLGIVLHPARWRTVVPRLAALVALIILVAAVLTQGAPVKDTDQGIAARAASAVSAGDYSIQGRLRFWKAGLAIFVDHPLVGTGPGTFGIVHPAYQRDVRYYARDPHSLYVQVLAEMGLLGAGGLAFLLIVVAVTWWRTLRSLEGREEYWLIAGVGMSLAAFFIHSGVEMNWMFPANPAMAFALIGVLAACDPSSRSRTPDGTASDRFAGRLVLTAVLLAAAAAAVVLWAAQRHFASGNEAAREGRLPLAAERYARAVRWNPLGSRYLDAYASTLARISGPRDPRVVGSLLRAMAVDRMNAALPLRLAQILLSGPDATKEHEADAETLLRRSLELDRFNRPESYRTLAGLYRRQGHLDDAARVYDGAMPLYLGGDLGRGSILYLALWPEVVGLFQDAADLAASRGDAGRAAAILESLLREDPLAVEVILQLSDLYVRMDRREDARALLEAAAAAIPGHPEIARALGRLR